MIPFKHFIRENVETTTRQNMLHLQKMKDEEFIQFVRGIKNEMGGKLKDLKVSLKVDGAGARFGKDANGRVFFEGSRTGPIFEPRAFSTHAKGRGATGEVLLRAQHYDEVWEIVTKSDFIKKLPNNSKVICELFYNPMADVTEDGIKFVSVTYDKSKLGKLMTIIPFRVVVASTGQEHARSSEIIKMLIDGSNNDIKFIDPNLTTTGDIDISAFVDPILSLNQQSLDILKSRKPSDKPAKDNIKAIIQKVKDAMAEYILNHQDIVGKFKLGPEIEGLVLKIGNQDVKVTTKEFKASKAREKIQEAKVSTEESDRKQMKVQEVQTTIGKGAFNSLMKHPWFTRYSSYEKAYVHSIDGVGFHHVEVFPYMRSVNTTAEGKIRPEFRLEFVISHFGKTGKVVQVHKFMRNREPSPNEIGGGWRHVNSWKDE